MSGTLADVGYGGEAPLMDGTEPLHPGGSLGEKSIKGRTGSTDVLVSDTSCSRTQRSRAGCVVLSFFSADR